MRKINVEFGSGRAALIFDQRSQEIHTYSPESAPAFVTPYYRSCSGLSGAGTFLARPYLHVLHTYRDVRGERPVRDMLPAWPVNRDGINYDLPVVFGIQVYYGSGYTLIEMGDPWGELPFCPAPSEPEEHELGMFEYYRYPHDERQQHAVRVRVRSGKLSYAWRRLAWTLAREGVAAWWRDKFSFADSPLESLLSVYQLAGSEALVRKDRFGVVVEKFSDHTELVRALSAEPDWLSPHGLVRAEDDHVVIGTAQQTAVCVCNDGRVEPVHGDIDWSAGEVRAA